MWVLQLGGNDEFCRLKPTRRSDSPMRLAILNRFTNRRRHLGVEFTPWDCDRAAAEDIAYVVTHRTPFVSRSKFSPKNRPQAVNGYQAVPPRQYSIMRRHNRGEPSRKGSLASANGVGRTRTHPPGQTIVSAYRHPVQSLRRSSLRASPRGTSAWPDLRSMYIIRVAFLTMAIPLLRTRSTFQLPLSVLRALFPRAASFGRVNPLLHLGTRVNPVEQLIGRHIGDLATTEALLRFGERLGHYRQRSSFVTERSSSAAGAVRGRLKPENNCRDGPGRLQRPVRPSCWSNLRSRRVLLLNPARAGTRQLDP